MLYCAEYQEQQRIIVNTLLHTEIDLLTHGMPACNVIRCTMFIVKCTL